MSLAPEMALDLADDQIWGRWAESMSTAGPSWPQKQVAFDSMWLIGWNFELPIPWLKKNNPTPLIDVSRIFLKWSSNLYFYLSHVFLPWIFQHIYRWFHRNHLNKMPSVSLSPSCCQNELLRQMMPVTCPHGKPIEGYRKVFRCIEESQPCEGVGADASFWLSFGIFCCIWNTSPSNVNDAGIPRFFWLAWKHVRSQSLRVVDFWSSCGSVSMIQKPEVPRMYHLESCGIWKGPILDFVFVFADSAPRVWDKRLTLDTLVNNR